MKQRSISKKSIQESKSDPLISFSTACSWWSPGFPWLIWLIGYLPFWLAAFRIHDLGSTRKQAMAAGGILAFDVACLDIACA